ncbi:hypothetical protein THARTR1_06927 [Trichoderma harzianum]|uniref:NADP-dependent oxidoreductase domain-containing protein n=1 Tax=Trichoderma harzianum TaxID=5544 RepID=A0A2K0U487_TRIHA|nr:hypothetical protein THARTR1_06927 [Trichoderma harzianum]
MKAAYDCGVNFFDCAEAYAGGESEKVMGEAIKKYGWNRNDLVISTKIYWGQAYGNNPVNNLGLSRKHIVEGVNAALKRLDLEYVDLIYAHRADRKTPMEEVVRAFNHIIDSGKAFYWGTSEWTAVEIAEAWRVADRLGLIGPLMEQPAYHMLNRQKVEGDYEILYREHGLGLTIFSPLYQGILSGKYKNGIPDDSRFAQTQVAFIAGYWKRTGKEVWEGYIEKVNKLEPIADRLGVKQSALALAWVLKNDRISSAITGASSPQQVYENVKALAVVDQLTPEILKEIDEILNNKPPTLTERDYLRAELAAQVAKAGGLGFLGCIADVSDNSPQVTKLDADLTKIRQLLGDAATTPSGHLGIGCGFLSCHKSIGNFAATALPVIRKHKPAAVWLFAPHESIRPQSEIVRLLKGLETAPRVFVQVGNVTAAEEAIKDGADVIVCQGTDAGGHQYIRGMGVVPLLAETRKLVDDKGYSEVSLFAAGGISDGKGVAAMLTLEADGVVLGTRFTVAEESLVPEFRKKIILDTTDGALSTLKSTFNDQIADSSLWGSLYDGRAVVGPIHEKFLAGASFYDCWRSLHDDHPPEESEKLINTWAGAGIGLVTKAQPAGEIVREVREGAKQAIRRVAARV